MWFRFTHGTFILKVETTKNYSNFFTQALRKVLEYNFMLLESKQANVFDVGFKIPS
jgi:hypothetical protein